MNKPLQEFINDITLAVAKYIADEECYTDNVQLRIDTATGEIEISDPDDDLDGYDYCPVMDLVAMSTENPGEWVPDAEAIAELAADYATA